MPLPEQLLLSDLLSRRVRCDRGLEHGAGQLGWMHPPVHRLLGWASRPSALSTRRCVWRLDQLRGFGDAEVLVEGDPAETDAATLERLPTLLGAVLLSGSGEPLGRLADATVELRSGRIRHYLVARSDPRLPGGSRWRLSPDRIVDQRPGEVATALQGLADLPMAHASLRETLLRRSRRWRDQWEEETSRLRDQWQQASGQFEQRLEGWLEEPPWDDEARSERPRPAVDQEIWPEQAGPESKASDHFGRSQRSQPWPDEREPWLEDDGDLADDGRSPAGARTGGGRPRAPQRRGWDPDPPEGAPPRPDDAEADADQQGSRWEATSTGRGRRPAASVEGDDDPWV